MAHSMIFELETGPRLFLNGREIMDAEYYRTLSAVRSAGVHEAEVLLGVSSTTVRRRLRKLEERLGQPVVENGQINQTGSDLLKQMEDRTSQLEEQLVNLWRKPTLTCDGLVISNNKILLVRRGKEPFKGTYALPGGIVEYGESTEHCVVREVGEETGLRTEVVGLLEVSSVPGRDPRGHFISLLYELKVVGGELAGGDDADSAELFPLDELPPLAFDHGPLLKKALKKVTEHSL